MVCHDSVLALVYKGMAPSQQYQHQYRTPSLGPNPNQREWFRKVEPQHTSHTIHESSGMNVSGPFIWHPSRPCLDQRQQQCSRWQGMENLVKEPING